jgi:hypothetical protein
MAHPVRRLGKVADAIVAFFFPEDTGFPVDIALPVDIAIMASEQFSMLPVLLPGAKRALGQQADSPYSLSWAVCGIRSKEKRRLCHETSQYRVDRCR